MKTKFRLLPRQFGEYGGKKCFEIEEVCISTNTMSFKEYIDCRGFGLVSSLFSTEQYDFINIHAGEMGLSMFDILMHINKKIVLEKTKLSAVYRNYINETKSELWDSPEKIYEYYYKKDNYNKLLNGESGDNLIRKYKTLIILNYFKESVDLAYQSIEELANISNSPSLEAVKKWVLATRNLSLVFAKENNTDAVEYINFNHDVLSWYNQSVKIRPIVQFGKETRYKIFTDSKLNNILSSAKKLYGKNDPLFVLGKLLVNLSIKEFWRKCEKSN